MMNDHVIMTFGSRSSRAVYGISYENMHTILLCFLCWLCYVMGFMILSRSDLWAWFVSSNGSITWWRHQIDAFSALLAICAGNSPVPGEFPAQRPVTRSFDVFFDLHPNKRLSKQWRGWWFETLSCPLWRHRNAYDCFHVSKIGQESFLLTWINFNPSMDK